jgi:hypothetical protein
VAHDQAVTSRGTVFAKATREEMSGMVQIGYTMMAEQAGPRELGAHAVGPSGPVSTSRSHPTTTSPDWSPSAMPPTRGVCSVPPRRPPNAFP